MSFGEVGVVFTLLGLNWPLARPFATRGQYLLGADGLKSASYPPAVPSLLVPDHCLTREHRSGDWLHCLQW